MFGPMDSCISVTASSVFYFITHKGYESLVYVYWLQSITSGCLLVGIMAYWVWELVRYSSSSESAVASATFYFTEYAAMALYLSQSSIYFGKS